MQKLDDFAQERHRAGRVFPYLALVGACLASGGCTGGQDSETEPRPSFQTGGQAAMGGNGGQPPGAGIGGAMGGTGAQGGQSVTGGGGGTAAAGGTGSTAAVGGTGGAAAAGGTGGTAAAGGTGGTAAVDGTGGTAAVGGTGGTAAVGGSAGIGGQSGAGGMAAGAGGTGGGVPTGGGSPDLNQNPFGCSFAWGTNEPDEAGMLTSYNYLQFMTKWIGWELNSDGTISDCYGCSWLRDQISATNLIPVYYAYFIAYLGHAHGYQDGNINPDGPNLTTHGAELLRNYRAEIIHLYEWYAQETHRVWQDKPLVWLLEGDFIQYSEDIQTAPLSMTELAELTADITDAIKENMPNAVVAINQTTWNSNEETDAFWGAMQAANVNYGMVWTTGVANNNGSFEAVASSYNQLTANYSYVHQLTGRKIFVDNSFPPSTLPDTWTNASADTINKRIAEGVIASNVNPPPADYPNRVAGFASQLTSTCD